MPAESATAHAKEPSTDTRMTVSEFLAWKGGRKGVIHELVNGVIRAQDQTSDTHGTIHASLAALITFQLDKVRPGYRLVMNTGVKPRLLANWNHRVPELAVTCQPNRADARHIPDPILIVEILSPSNKDDTWSNIALYATLPSVAEILVVDSERIGAEVLRRQADGSWPQEPETIAADGAIRFDSIGLEVALAQVYRNTYLAA